jgi:indole-3-glycerol phosphate synthase
MAKGILREIIRAKKAELARKKKEKPLKELLKEAGPAERDFRKAVESKKHPINLIAEIKKASPSAGALRENFDAKQIASVFERHAQAISVITDGQFFQGSLEFVREAKSASSLPVLRKDFIIDDYQLFESLAVGADAVLLIASVLSRQKLQRLLGTAKDIGLQCLVEVHDSRDFERAFCCEAELIGINNRNLETMRIDLGTFAKIRRLVPSDRIVVAESGYESRQQIDSLKGTADAVLVGSALMKAQNIEEKLVELGF